jgi:hypothetical protein
METMSIKEYQDSIHNYSNELKTFLNRLGEYVGEEYLTQHILVKAFYEQEEMNRQEVASWWVEYLTEELEQLEINGATFEEALTDLENLGAQIEF